MERGEIGTDSNDNDCNKSCANETSVQPCSVASSAAREVHLDVHM